MTIRVFFTTGSSSIEIDLEQSLEAVLSSIDSNEKQYDAKYICNLTEKERLELVEKESPEFLLVLQDMQTKLNEVSEILIPLSKKTDR